MRIPLKPMFQTFHLVYSNGIMADKRALIDGHVRHDDLCLSFLQSEVM